MGGSPRLQNFSKKNLDQCPQHDQLCPRQASLERERQIKERGGGRQPRQKIRVGLHLSKKCASPPAMAIADSTKKQTKISMSQNTSPSTVIAAKIGANL